MRLETIIYPSFDSGIRPSRVVLKSRILMMLIRLGLGLAIVEIPLVYVQDDL